jgi:SAM-dependent methyltransferase
VVRGGAPRRRPARPVVVSAGAAAYSATGGAWQRGPGRIYDRLAEVLVERAPTPLAGARMLDVGAGTGAATRAMLAAGAASVVAIDSAIGMLAHASRDRPPAVAGDAQALPFATGTFDGTVAAFSLNHLSDPAAGLREMARVTRRGGCLLASAYAADDTHPVKQAVEAALAARGWTADPWYLAVRYDATPQLATPERAADAVHLSGLEARVHALRVPFPDLGPGDLVEWRLGLAQHAPFVAGLAPAARAAVVAEATALLGNRPPPLVRSMVVIEAVKP